jgi:hypothetical protein
MAALLRTKPLFSCTRSNAALNRMVKTVAEVAVFYLPVGLRPSFARPFFSSWPALPEISAPAPAAAAYFGQRAATPEAGTGPATGA